MGIIKKIRNKIKGPAQSIFHEERDNPSVKIPVELRGKKNKKEEEEKKYFASMDKHNAYKSAYEKHVGLFEGLSQDQITQLHELNPELKNYIHPDNLDPNYLGDGNISEFWEAKKVVDHNSPIADMPGANFSEKIKHYKFLIQDTGNE